MTRKERGNRTNSFELKDNKALISYSIAKDMRGKGFGTKMVLMAEEKLKEAGGHCLCMAQVKYETQLLPKYLKSADMKHIRRWNI